MKIESKHINFGKVLTFLNFYFFISVCQLSCLIQLYEFLIATLCYEILQTTRYHYLNFIKTCLLSLHYREKWRENLKLCNEDNIDLKLNEDDTGQQEHQFLIKSPLKYYSKFYIYINKYYYIYIYIYLYIIYIIYKLKFYILNSKFYINKDTYCCKMQVLVVI